MSPAKLWLSIFGAGFAVIVGLLALTLLTPIPYGDLSRIGLISDDEFGWHHEPPQVAPEAVRGVPIAEADIVVIGDSFSMTHRWQSVLAQAGYRVTTTYWGQINDTLCDDFSEWLERAGFKGKLVVLESVERVLDVRLRATQECKVMKKPFAAQELPFLEPLAHVPGFALNWTAKLSTGWITRKNTREAEKVQGATESGNRVLARPVPDGCELFSHRLCRKALFFEEDDINGELDANHVAQMRAFDLAHPDIPILWMIVPNKTTTYVVPDHSQQFVTALRRSGLGPDLFSFARLERVRVRDFYFPNDTHLSMTGQLALGKRMLEEVRKLVPALPAKKG